MLVYFLIGLLWPRLLFYWLLIIAPSTDADCPERHRGCCALFYRAYYRPEARIRHYLFPHQQFV
jgi:hypothetical protein